MRFHRLIVALAGLVVLAGCGGLGESGDDGASEGGKVTLSWLVDNSEQTLKPAEARADAVHCEEPGHHHQGRDAAKVTTS